MTVVINVPDLGMADCLLVNDNVSEPYLLCDARAASSCWSPVNRNITLALRDFGVAGLDATVGSNAGTAATVTPHTSLRTGFLFLLERC